MIEIIKAMVKFKEAYTTDGLQDFITFCLNNREADLDMDGLYKPVIERIKDELNQTTNRKEEIKAKINKLKIELDDIEELEDIENEVRLANCENAEIEDNLEEEYNYLIKDWNGEGEEVWGLYEFLIENIKDKDTIIEFSRIADNGNMSDYMEIAIEQYEKEKNER